MSRAEFIIEAVAYAAALALFIWFWAVVPDFPLPYGA